MRLVSLIPLLAAAPAFAAGPAPTAQGPHGVDSPNQPVVSGNRAYVPNCPNWGSGPIDSASRTDANYGCAVNSNLAAMIADPQDLLHGKTDPLTGHDPETATRTLKNGKATVVTGQASASTPTAKGGN